LDERRLLKRPIWLVMLQSTKGMPVVLCQIDAKFRWLDDEEWPEEHEDSLQG